MRRGIPTTFQMSDANNRGGPPIGGAFVIFVVGMGTMAMAMAVAPGLGSTARRVAQHFFTAAIAVVVVAGAIALFNGLLHRSFLSLSVGAFLVGPCAVLTAQLGQPTAVADPRFDIAIAAAAATGGMLLVRGWRGPRWLDAFVGLGVAGFAMAAGLSEEFPAVLGSLSLGTFVCLSAAACVYGALIEIEIENHRARCELDETRETMEEDRLRFEELLHDLRSGLLGIEATAVAVVDDRARVLADEAARLRAMTDRERSPNETFDLVRGVRSLAAAGQCDGLEIDLRSPESVHVIGSEPQILSVVQNLIDNGRRHGRGAIRVELVIVKGELRLSVSDAGPGPETRDERIFQRGFSTNRSGTGLGLAAARRLAEANGGALRFDPTPELPSRFVIDLPLQRTATARGRR